MTPDTKTPANGEAFEKLLEYLKNIRGFDFTGYKRSTLQRRINRRMQRIGVDSYADYIDYLEAHPDEFPFLFNTILINVTTFFRDPAAWQALAAEVVPQILESKKPGEAIRCWCAGVASGEEAYTLAIVLAEALGIEEFQRRVKIYATDVDEEALTHARTAAYSIKEVQVIPPHLRQKYFEVFDSKHIFRGDLRRLVIFDRHDLTQDAPISELDLLVIRNTLMYFNAETQSRILARLHLAVNDTGFLFLGKAEMLIGRSNLFKPFNLRFRIFSKIPEPHIIDPHPNLTRSPNGATPGPETRNKEE